MHKEGSIVFHGGIEYSNREEPHTQLLPWSLVNGYPAIFESPDAYYALEIGENGVRQMVFQTDYQEKDHYQVKWWVILPFSETVTVDGEPVDVYSNTAEDIAGLVYGRKWTRVKFLPVKEGMKIQVGRFAFTLQENNVKELMIYRRLDNQRIELSYIWWNTDRYGEIPAGIYHAEAELTIDGAVPTQAQPSPLNRIINKLRRLRRRLE